MQKKIKKKDRVVFMDTVAVAKHKTSILMLGETDNFETVH